MIQDLDFLGVYFMLRGVLGIKEVVSFVCVFIIFCDGNRFFFFQLVLLKIDLFVVYL